MPSSDEAPMMAKVSRHVSGMFRSWIWRPSVCHVLLAASSTCKHGAPTLMTAVYNQAQRAPCTLRFHVATEGGWDIGAASGLLIAAFLIWHGVPFPLVLLLPLVGLAVAFAQLHRYYAGLGPEATRIQTRVSP